MPTVEATWVWNPVPNATGYRLFVDGAQIHEKTRPNYVVELELAEGDHDFSVEAFNDVGPGPRATVTRNITVPRAPGAVEGFDVSLRILSPVMGGGSVPPAVDPPVEGSNEARLDALLGSYTIPFSGLQYPADPDTQENVVEVSSYSAFNSAIQTSNRKIVVSGDCRGSLASPANDIWIELADGAQIGNAGGVWDFGFGGVQRMRISSQTPRLGELHGGLTFPTSTTDVLIDGVTFVEVSSSGSARHNIYDSSRIAIINSHVTGNNFTLLANSGTNADVILANSRFVARNVPAGGNGAIRLKDINRLVIVDVFGDTETNDTGYEPLRLEDDVHNVYVNNFLGEGGGLRISRMVGSSNPTDLWIYNSNFHHDSFLGISHNDGSASNVIRLTMADCTFYTPNATPGSNVISSPQASWDILNVVYAAYESAPAWNFQ